MTQLQKFISLYKEFGIDLQPTLITPGSNHDGRGYIYVDILVPEKRGDEDLISGYSGFSTTIFFDEKENFLYQAIWE